MKITLLAAIASIVISSNLSFAENRIWLKGAEIGGKPVKLIFDSGSNLNALSPEAVKRLGLKPDANRTNFPVEYISGVVEHCPLTLDGLEVPTYFAILKVPDYVGDDFDGLIGWFPSENVVRIDAEGRKVDFFSKVPKNAVDWAWFSVITNLGTLDLRVPDATNSGGIISIDTGSDWGVGLPPRYWRQWKEAHPHSPTTLKAFYSPNDGFVVLEEAWADRVTFGPLVLTDVPISEEVPSGARRWGDKDDGTLGLAALNRFDLIVDGANSVAYLKPKTKHPPVYAHNRLGAIFVPRPTNTNFVAKVITGSPAYDAGIRDGDVLLQVDGIPVVNWTADWIDRFALPRETKLHLVLKRDGTNFNTIAILRDIIPQVSAKSRKANLR